MKLKKKARKVYRKVRPLIKGTKNVYNLGKETVSVLKRDLGIKSSKKKKKAKRWATSEEFNRAMFG